MLLLGVNIWWMAAIKQGMKGLDATPARLVVGRAWATVQPGTMGSTCYVLKM